MDKLAHLSTFVSLIYGLGVANVLAHLARLIKHGSRADWYWVHTLWSLNLLLMMASFWWVLQNWATVPRIGYLNYLTMLLVPCFLLLASDLLFPTPDGTGKVDLNAHFFKVRKPFFLCVIGVVAADELDSLQKGWEHVRALGPYYWGTQPVWWLMCLVGMHSERERVHAALVLLNLLLFAGGMINALAYV